MIYGIPACAGTVLKIDPSTNTADTTAISTSSTYSSTCYLSGGWHGGVLAPNGMIYATPITNTMGYCTSDVSHILVIDPSYDTADTSIELPSLYETSHTAATYGGWRQPTLGSNGEIYALPSSAGESFLVIEPLRLPPSTPPPSTPPPSTPPPSTPPEGEDPCFPSMAMVTKADGTLARVDSLKEGDAVAAVSSEGDLTMDTISLLSIAKPEARGTTFLMLTTDTKANLTLTPEHHLPVGTSCCSTIKQAKNVMVGETVWTVENGAIVATALTKMSKVIQQGLHSPVLTNGGFPVVNGLVTAFDSFEKVKLAEYTLRYALPACKASGTCDLFRRTFLSSKITYIDSA